MKERQILFNGEMVRAILARRKTQTRRPIDRVLGIGKVHNFEEDGLGWAMRNRRDLWYEVDHDDLLRRCPYGVAGDRLWVRETWAATSLDSEGVPLEGGDIEYRADRPRGCDSYSDLWPDVLVRKNPSAPKWRPSIHMPRWASRIDLEITDVTVSQLWNLRAKDCLAEGIHPRGVDPVDIAANLVDDFQETWDRIYADRGFGWDLNPWVWVIEFRPAGKGQADGHMPELTREQWRRLHLGSFDD